MDQFRLHRFKGMSVTAALHIFCNQGQNVSQSIGHNPGGGQNVKSHKISDLIMFCSWISSSNGNQLSRPHGIPSLILANYISSCITCDYLTLGCPFHITIQTYK